MLSDGIINMTESELLSRKNSITKDKLFEAFLSLKNRMNNNSNDEQRRKEELSQLLNDKLDPFISEFKKLREHCETLERKIREIEDDNKTKGSISRLNDKDMMRVLDETHQISLRRSNIIIAGLPEPSGSVVERIEKDTAEVKELASILGIRDLQCSEIRRLGS